MKMRSMTKRSLKVRSLLLGAAVSLGLASWSQASVLYSYVVQPQGAIVNNANNTLNLYLQEVSTAGSFSAASDGGLYSAGVALVEQTGGTGVTFTSAGVSNNGAAEPGGFSGNNTKGLVTSGGAWITDITSNGASVGVAPASSTTANGTTTNLYLLGSVVAAVGSNPNATFKVESLHDAPANDGIIVAGSDGNTFSYGLNSQNNYDLDVTGAGGAPGATGADGHPSSFSVGSSPVPEPASLAIFGVAAAGLLVRRRQNTSV